MKKSYLLKGIEPDLWKEFKAVCVNIDVTIRQVFLDTINITIATYNKEMGGVKGKQTQTKKGGKKR